MFLELIINSASAIGTIVIAFVAFKGFNKWQSEIKGRANFDLARSLLGAAYHLRDEIAYCRNPHRAAHEYPEDFDHLKGDYDAKENEAERFIYSNRLKSVYEAWDKFNSFASEAEVLWADELKEDVVVLKKCVIELSTYTQTWLGQKHNFQKNPSNGEEYKRVIEAPLDGDDDFSLKLEAAIKEFENKLRLHIDFYKK